MKVKTTPTPAAPKRADAHGHTASCKEDCGVALRLIASHENIASESADDSTGHMQSTCGPYSRAPLVPSPPWRMASLVPIRRLSASTSSH